MSSAGASSIFDSLKLPRLPAIAEDGRHSIAIIGAGAIVTSAHLPAYRSVGARVRGIYDIDSTRAERAAATFGIPETYPDLDALLNDHEVDIVDIAVPPQVQEQLVPKLITAGKHLLCQKPLAMTAMTAQTLVGLASAASVRMGVNVNMRWSPAIRAIKQLMEKEVFGPVTSVLMNVNFWDDWTTWPWLRNERELLIRYDAIHLIDSLRFLFGEAQSIYATASRLPNSPVKGETDVSLVFRYPEFTTFIHDSADNWAGDTCAEFRIEGTDATTKGILGVWYDYPVGRDDRIDLQRNCQRGDWITFHPPGRWVPDAWAWTMAEMFDAIDSGRDPIHNGQDHVQTLKYVEAAYESIQHNRVVTL